MKNNRYLSAFIFTITLSSLMSSACAQLADGKCKFLGNVISNSVPSSFNTYWNQVTPENSGKWGSVEGTRDVMNWSALDLAYNHAKSNGFPFKQHTFVWGQQQPAWISTLVNDTSIPQEERYQQVREEVEEWIQQYCERYPDTDLIDVVNEPLHAIPSYSLALGNGWNWMIWAFEKTRQYCPNAKLILNDYNIINTDATTDNYVTLINILKAENLIDIIGVQCHRFETENVPDATLKGNLDKLAATGLPIHITEFDIGNINNEGVPDDDQQLEIMQRVFPLLWAHPAVQGITVWGYIQGQTWQNTAYLLQSDGTTERPAMTWLKNYVVAAPGGSFCMITGIGEQEGFLVNVYPNPSPEGKFVIESTEQVLNILIRDTQGKIVTRQTVNANESAEIQVGDSPGIYLLEVFNGKQTLFRKLIVQ